MSNTYFEIKKVNDNISNKPIRMELSLTAFMGGDQNIQMTLTSDGGWRGHSETAYITLTNEEQDKLIAAIMERRWGSVSATNGVKSDYSPPTD